ncbi:MAG: class I SAM-dependent RNA methyltransferase, partial [Phototrophicaceae bacterium]
MPLHNVTITSMTHGGEGVGRLPNGKAVFVPYTLPDEVIAIEVTQERKTFARARLLEVETPSPARIAARCAHFGICGGCHWQHIAYDTQLTLKRQIVQDQLTRIGKLTDPLVHPTIPSPQQWNYRAHVTFHGIADGVAFVGADKSSKVELHECHIIAPELWDVRYVSNGKRVRLLLGDGGAILGSEGQREGDTELDSVGVGDSFVTLTVLGKPFKVSAGSFFQVNLPQAAKLVELILSALALNGTERVLDLYSGVGLFSAFLAERAA